MTNQTKDNWEERFDEKFVIDKGFVNIPDGRAVICEADKLRAFIHTTIEEERERVIRKVVKEIKKTEDKLVGQVDIWDGISVYVIKENVKVYFNALTEAIQKLKGRDNVKE